MGKIYLGVSKCFAFYKNTKSFVFNKTSILNLISANYICVEILLWLIAFIFNDIEFLKKRLHQVPSKDYRAVKVSFLNY